MKNLYKFSLVSALVLFFTIFISFSAFAAATPDPTPTPTNIHPANMVADVDIINAKIVSHTGNTYQIVFDLKNGTGVQTGVKYGVELLSGANNQNIIDSKIYDESLNLPENSLIERQITYTAPNISGDYNLVISSENSSGLPLGIGFLGKVTLNASTGIEIVNNSCNLKIVGDKTAKQYGVLQGVNISKDQSLNLSCSVINHDKASVTVTPKYETRVRSAFGNIIETTGGDIKPITLKPGVKILVSLALPKTNTPNIYNLKISLANGSNSSNSVEIHYAITGPTATIENIYLDKDAYKNGDTAIASLVWTKSPGTQVFFSGSITDGDGNLCSNGIDKQEINIDPANPMNKISFAITSDCNNPKISAKLADSNGTVLDQKSYSFVSNGTSGSAPKKHSATAIILILLILIIVWAIYMLNRRNKMKSNSINMNVFLPFLMLLAVGGFMLPGKAFAGTFKAGTGGEINVDYADINQNYKAGDTIDIAVIQLTNNTQGVQKSVNLIANNDGNNQQNLILTQIINGSGGGTLVRNINFTAPSPQSGTHHAINIIVGVDEPTIYVKVTKINEVHRNAEGMDGVEDTNGFFKNCPHQGNGYFYIETITEKAEFFSDAAATIPIDVTGLNFKLKQEGKVNDTGNADTYNIITNEVPIASGTSYTYEGPSYVVGPTEQYGKDSCDFAVYYEGFETIDGSSESPTPYTLYSVPTPPPVPAISISASPSNVQSGGNSTITWSATNANACTSIDFPTNNATSGSVQVGPVSTATAYGISCSGSGGTTNSSASVTVTSDCGGQTCIQGN